MAEKCDLPIIIDDIIRDVSIKVAKLDLCSYDPARISLENRIAVITTVTGNFEGSIVFSSDNHVIRGISENMKHEQITQESEIEIYAVEFFNILCGRIITALCNRSRLPARFNIPQLLPGGPPDEPVADGVTRFEWCYGSRCGPMLIQMGLRQVLN